MENRKVKSAIKKGYIYMATLCKRTGKTPGYEIQFFDTNGRRLTIYLGGRRYSERTANELKNIVETLVYNCDNSLTTLDKRTLAWIESASPEIREKLVKAKLIDVPPEKTVKELWDVFLKQKTDIKESTETTYENAKRRFFEFFEETELLSELAQTRMKEWKTFLLESLAESTVAGTLTKAKAVFNWSIESGWMEKSPLDGVGRGSFINRSKDRFITMEEYLRLLDACPCSDWKVIISLARIGGLRCPSEVLRLRWTDVNWEKGRFYVSSSKTEHHKGKEGRIVPIFPDLRSELENLFFQQESEGKEFVVNRYRDPERTNLGTQFARIVKMAGILSIPRPFDNMRASRSTEVYAEYGAFLESKWIGHSSKIAHDHYLQVREADFERASGRVIDRAISDKETDYVKCVESCRENLQKNTFPAPEKNFPAVFPAAREGIERQRAAIKK